MIRLIKSHGTALLLLAALTACSEPTAPVVDTGLTGEWQGTMVDYRDETLNRTVWLSLQQNGDVITGNAVSQMFAVSGSAATVDGRVQPGGTVTLTIRAVHLGGCYDIEATLVESGDGLIGDYIPTEIRGGCGRVALGRRPAFEVWPQ